MAAERDELEVEGVLADMAEEAIPAPSPDLIARSIARVQGWLLTRELIRVAVLEGLWKRPEPARRDESGQPAEPSERPGRD